jgi:hypothetical protein
MKSKIQVGTTFPADGTSHAGDDPNIANRGFDGKLVGIQVTTGSIYFGNYSEYWTASSAATVQAKRRVLRWNVEGLYRGNGQKYEMRSVRCKKN